jgi:hypothetical protein
LKTGIASSAVLACVRAPTITPLVAARLRSRLRSRHGDPTPRGIPPSLRQPAAARRAQPALATHTARRLRAICLALPEATEKIAWGEPTWRVRGKLFAQLDDHHHGADHLAVWLPAPSASKRR